MRRAEYQDGEAQDRARIETLLAKANEYHLAACRAATDHLRFAIETGEVLRKLKKLIRHGGWRAWLKDNEKRLGFSARTATDYLKMAKLSDPNRQRAADLMSVRAALKALAAQSGKPQDPTPRPTLSEPHTTLVDACIQQAGADAVLAYIRNLEQANEVAPHQLDEAVKSWKRAEARR